MIRIEALYSNTHAHALPRNILYKDIQNILIQRLLFINSILGIIHVSYQKYFITYQNLLKIVFEFQLLAWAGRPTGRPSLCQVKLVDRPSRLVFCLFWCISVHVYRSTGLSTGALRSTGRLADWSGATLCLFRPTGRSTDSLQRLFLFESRSTGRPTEVAVSAITASFLNTF